MSKFNILGVSHDVRLKATKNIYPQVYLFYNNIETRCCILLRNNTSYSNDVVSGQYVTFEI